MHKVSRREFLQSAGAALLWPVFSDIPLLGKRPAGQTPPTSLGRVARWREALREEASPSAKWVAWKKYDEVIPLYAAVEGKAPWVSNPIWFQTDGGFVHSAFVQPVENTPQSNVVTEVANSGIWVQVCVPIAELRWQPDSRSVARKVYYGTVYRAVKAVQNKAGDWWYQLKEGIGYSAGPYVPAWAMRYLPPEELAPLSPGQPDKHIEIDIAKQQLACFEGERLIFSSAIASGLRGTITPRGQYRVLTKRHTDWMIGGEGDNYYNLPGVPFPVYFTWSGIATHGTYWHNDYGRPKSHGCVNVPSEVAKLIFRWTEPSVPYQDYALRAKPDEGTPINVV